MKFPDKERRENLLWCPHGDANGQPFRCGVYRTPCTDCLLNLKKVADETKAGKA